MYRCIEVRQRFIEQKDPAAEDQRAGNRNRLLLATGQICGLAIEVVRNPRDLGHLTDPVADVPFFVTRNALAKCNVLERRHRWKGRIILENDAHAALLWGARVMSLPSNII